MIKGVIDGHRKPTGEPTKIIILGITEANVHRMREGMPVDVDGRELNMPGIDIVIMFGKDERTIAKEVMAQIPAGVPRQVIPMPEAVVERRATEDRDKLVQLATTAATALGYVLAERQPDSADGAAECDDCGEEISNANGTWIHTGPGADHVHGCRYGEGCAHPAQLRVVT
jgi:hypothetical protein